MIALAMNPTAGQVSPHPDFPLRGLVRAGSSLPLPMQGYVFWWRVKAVRATYPEHRRWLRGYGYKSLPGNYLGEDPEKYPAWSWHANRVDLILDPTAEQVAEELRQAQEETDP